NDPDRLVVDLSGANAGKVSGHRDGMGPVAGVVTSQFNNERSSVGRVLIALDNATKYDVKADGSRLVISVDGSLAGAAAQGAPPTVAAAPAAPEPKAAEAAAPEAKATEAAQTPSSGEGVVASRVDETTVRNPAHALKAVRLR